MPTSTPATRLSKRILNNYHGKHAPSAQSVAEYMKHIGKRTKTVTNIDWVLFKKEANDIGKAVKLYIGNVS